MNHLKHVPNYVAYHDPNKIVPKLTLTSWSWITFCQDDVLICTYSYFSQSQSMPGIVDFAEEFNLQDDSPPFSHHVPLAIN